VSPPRPPKTPFDLAIEAEYDDIMKFLKYACRKRNVRGDDVDDAIGETFRVAYEREIDGPPWDPKVLAITLHLGVILQNHLRVRRRRVALHPTTPLEKEHDVTSESATIEEAVEDLEEEESRANDVRKVLAAETTAGLTLRILDALRRGIDGHQNIADDLKVPVQDVRNGFRRIARRMAALAGRPKKGGGK
jgi:DNA-directed RNA polymerase specialized sigma24 family protein